MNHPGIKSLFDRVMKTQPRPATKPSVDKSVEICFDFDESAKKLSEGTKPNSFCRLAEFKENLKMRMKARRVQIRQEEKEDEQIDEEYNLVKDKKDEESEDEFGSEKKTNKKAISDESSSEDEQDEAEDEDEEENSEDELKLNLDEDDEEVKSEKQRKKDCYEFGEEDDDDVPTLSLIGAKSKNTSVSEFPLTNSIPSNQLTKVLCLLL